MRIAQGYVSKSIADFPFHEVYRISDYFDIHNPSVFFGMYRYEDMVLLEAHRSKKVVLWTGQDALKFNKWHYLENVINVTAHPKVHELITSKKCYCKLVKPAAFLNEPKPQKLGKRIYAYCPSSMPEYHGKDILDKLIRAGYDITIGDGNYTRCEWKRVFADEHYKDVFVGLCLSPFAGGGESIIEMGLRGIRVVTNVFDLPNCISWNSFEDVMTAIENETSRIGYVENKLVTQVWNDLDHKHQWLNI